MLDPDCHECQIRAALVFWTGRPRPHLHASDVVTLPDITIQPVTEADRVRARVTALLDEEQARIDAFRLSQGRGFQRPYRFFDQIREALRG